MSLAGRSAVHLVRALLAGLAVAMLVIGGQPSAAAAPWREPVVVYRTTGYTANPTLVADSAGDAHLFFMSSDVRDFDPSQPSAIWYARLHQGRWTQPVDVLATPGGGSSTQEAVALDSRGFLHVVWKGAIGDGRGTLYYSRTHIDGASSPRSWTPAIQVSDTDVANGAFGEPGAIAVGPDDTIHVAYATHDRRLVYRRSSDGGRSWSPPTTLADFTNGPAAPDDVRIVTDGPDRVFATCSTFGLPSGWPPMGTYFAGSMDGGASWLPATRVSSDGRGLLTLASDNAGRVYRLWYSVAEIGEHTGQGSTDGGQTWRSPDRFLPQLKGGLTGFAGLAYDSLGILHVALSASAGQTGIWATAWDGTSWADPVFLSRGSVTQGSVEEPALTVGLGNQLHVAWEDDFQRIWYTSQLLEAPALPARAIPPAPHLPTPVAHPTQPPDAPPTPIQSTRATTEIDSSSPRIDPDSQPLLPILGPALPIVVLLGVVVVAYLRRLA